MLSVYFTNKILRELHNKKVLFYRLSVRYLVVKPGCVNAASLKQICLEELGVLVAYFLDDAISN